MTHLTIASWNVNGLRACGQKGFPAWLETSGVDIAALQEVRATESQLPADLRAPPGWTSCFAPAVKAGYSGVGLYLRRPLDRWQSGCGEARFDDEGRLQRAELGNLLIVNGYFPNGNGSLLEGGKRSNDRIPFKLDFYRKVFDMVAPDFAAGRPILVMGDFNTAHTELDLARPKANVTCSGFTPIERAEFDRWLRAGWIDTFRYFHPGQAGHYSWWSQRFGVREKNIGWRLDYVLASPGALPFLRSAFISREVLGSDHCPVGVVLDAAVLSA